MENKLAVSFENLVFTMQKYDLYQKGDEVDNDIQIVMSNITEMLNRLAVIDVANERINTTIREYQGRVDKGELFKMSVEDYDKILYSTNDIEILTDFDNMQPIDEDWEGMLKIEKPKTIDELLTDFYLELEKEYQHFYYDNMSGTCHIGINTEFTYDCTPFWEDAKGISVCLNKDCEPISSYIINCEEPTNAVELEKFKEFYRIQVELMIKAIS